MGSMLRGGSFIGDGIGTYDGVLGEYILHRRALGRGLELQNQECCKRRVQTCCHSIEIGQCWHTKRSQSHIPTTYKSQGVRRALATKLLSEKAELISSLARHQETTPFKSCPPLHTFRLYGDDNILSFQ